MSIGSAASPSFLIYRGAAARLRFAVTDRNTGNPIDVTSWTTQFRMRVSETAADPPTLDKTGGIADGPAGLIDVAITKTDSLALTVKKYVYGFERIDSGFEEELAKGQVEVQYDVINPK